MSRYAAVVISYLRPDLARDVLDQLAKQTLPPAAVYVVDNSGDLPDATIDGPLSTITRIIRRPENPGYAAAVNSVRSFVTDGRDHLLVLTHDAVFGPDLASSLFDQCSEIDIGAAAPIIYRASSPQTLFSAGGVLTKSGRAYHLQNLPAPDDGSSMSATVDWVDGAIVLYSVKALESIGWLDERYFLYFEDVDTAWRMRQRGFRTIVCLGERAFQDPGAHPPYLGMRNMTLFAKKAGIPAWRNAAAVAYRTAEESTVAITHKHLPPLRSSLRGWRDGHRGMHGKEGL